MKRIIIICMSVLWLSATIAQNQGKAIAPDSELARQIELSDYIHRPLPLDTVHSLEAILASKPIVRDIPLDAVGDESRWSHQGLGRIDFVEGGLRMRFPIETGRRPRGAEGDSDYALFGSCRAMLSVGGQDWSVYNRIVMDIYPACEGDGIMNMNLYVDNGGGNNLGAHLINLRNNRWNHVEYEIGGLRRDRIYSLTFYTDLKGRNLFKGDSLTYLIRNIRLQQVDRPAKEAGWQVEDGQIAYSMSGYLTEGGKTALVAPPFAPRFQLVRVSDGQVAFEGTVSDEQTTLGRFGVADFSDFQQLGIYRLVIGSLQTEPFAIGDDVFVNSEWRILNYLFCQRCGDRVEGIHAMCHADLMSDFRGVSRTYMGGWHDAGDLSQQTLQSGDVAFGLLEAYNRHRLDNPVLANRLREEAEWGLRFVLRNRLGDGWHASSMGLLHWTDGKLNTYDDIHTVRVQDCAFDNFLYAAYEAYAAMSLDGQTALADTLRQAAIEDFQFGQAKYEKDGFDVFPHMMEHSYNTSPSQQMATMSWSASMLYRLTGDKRYARLAVDYIRYVLSCQETQGARAELNGYFYRDTTRRAIVHYIHQSRDQVFAQALAELLQSQPRHRQQRQWRAALRRYGDYLKSLMAYTAPYGMVPSGTYQTEEWRDTLGFRNLHLFAPQNAQQLYEEQIRQGIQLDATHYVRRFPTWFSIFNGNEAIVLSTGKAAAVCGKALGDSQLLNIGREQLYWTVGKNPFVQSLIYGEGHRYPSMDSFSSGEITGEIPVGIRAMGNDDVPYWPQTNNACYKEVWTTSAGKWLSLLAEY